MATKQQTVEAAAKGMGALGHARMDEEVFVLRAEDAFALQAIIDWSTRVLRSIDVMGIASTGDKAAMLKVADALRCAARMLEQQVERGCKVPD